MNTERLSALRQNIHTEKGLIAKLKAEVASRKKTRDKDLAQLQNKTVSETMLEQARLAVESTRVNIQSIKLDLNNEKKKIQNLQTEILTPRHTLVAPKGTAEAQSQTDRLTMAKSLLALESQYIDLLTTHLGLLQEKAGLAASWLQAVQAVYQHQQLIRHQESLDDIKRYLQQQEKKIQAQSRQLQQELSALNLNDPDTRDKREFLKKQLEELKESLNILKTKVTIQTMKSEYDGMDFTQLNTLPSATLQEDMKALQQMVDKLNPLMALTQGRLNIFQQQWTLLQKQYALKNVSRYFFTQEKKILTGLIDQFTSLSVTMKALHTKILLVLNRVNKAYGASVQQSLTARQSLPRDLATWKNLFSECSSLPGSLKKNIAKSIAEIQSGWSRATPDQKLAFAAGILLLVIFSLVLGRCTKGGNVQKDELNFSGKFKVISRSLLRAGRPSIVLGGSLLLAGWIFQVDSTIFHIFLLLVGICVALQIAIRLSYWLFASPLIPPAQRQPRLRHMVNYAALLSALFTFLVGLGNMGFFSIQLQAVIDRLFMVLLLLVVYFFLRLRTLLISSLSPEKRSNFWVRLLVLASFSIPLTALSAALVGLAGYINLAWFVAGQLAIFLVVILAWVVVRDLLRELLDNRVHLFEMKTRKHDVPILRFMSPLKRVVDLLLLLVVLWLLARLYGWGTGSLVSDFLETWLNSPLFHFGAQEITLINLLTSLFLLVLFFYLGSLARQIAYAWLYGNVSDRGLRNSLSVFTQYAVLVIGALISLNSMGINLTSLTVFAGALGVGIGFGLQNIANNLISGLILLAERPIRVDDWVTVGASQGIVSRIGLRALVLTTWDNQNVIVPNAQLISNPVTNWTLSDNLIRTVFQVGVRYQDDPHRAGEVILDAVLMVPEVSLERKPKIFLSEFADSSINFRVDFFSELDDQHSRLEVKSKVMFAIWDALQEADIGIPFPQRDIYIKEMPMGNSLVATPIQQENDRKKTVEMPDGGTTATG